MKSLILGFVTKFYEVIIVSLLALILALSLVCGYQSLRAKAFQAELKAIEESHNLKIEKIKTDNLTALAEANARADIFAKGYEDEKIKQKEVVRTIEKRVEKFIDRPVYLNICLDDDGLHEINSAVKAYDTK